MISENPDFSVPAAAEPATLTLSYGDADARRFVSSQEDLAVALGGISRRTVARLLKLPGNPGKTANGSYPIRAWVEFYQKTKGEELPEDVRSELAVLRRDRERIRKEKELLELDVLKKKLIPADVVQETWNEFFASVRTMIYKTFVEETDTGEEFARAKRKFDALMRRIHESVCKTDNQ